MTTAVNMTALLVAILTLMTAAVVAPMSVSARETTRTAAVTTLILSVTRKMTRVPRSCSAAVKTLAMMSVSGREKSRKAAVAALMSVTRKMMLVPR